MNKADKIARIGAVLDILHVYIGIGAVAVGAGLIYFPAGVIAGGALLLGLGLMRTK